RLDSHTIAHKERPKRDAGRRLKASVWRRNPLKKRSKGDSGIVMYLPISSVLREMQGDYQGILRMGRTHQESLKEGPGTRQLPKGNHPTGYAKHARSPSRGP
ncbi:hypothetical protein Prudu_1504S000200, partial [Prunus dulcis]